MMASATGLSQQFNASPVSAYNDETEDADTPTSNHSVPHLTMQFDQLLTVPKDMSSPVHVRRSPDFGKMESKILTQSIPMYESGSQGTTVAESTSKTSWQAVKTAPLFSPDAVASAGRICETETAELLDSLTQYGYIGRNLTVERLKQDFPGTGDANSDEWESLVLANMDAPWSAFICGSQGAGKSHTLSCLLENGLLQNEATGSLANPLAAMVFHYDSYTKGLCSQVCEAAYLCSSGIPVTILVAPSNIWAMTELYTNLPGLPRGAPRPKVLPLYLSESSLDVATMLKLMAIDPNSKEVPLYMEIVMQILREMAMEGKGAAAFSYSEFRQRLDAVDWVSSQRVPLDLRLQLLDSFLEPSDFTKTTRPARAAHNIWSFPAGSLTIVDLSDPFVGSSDACSLFAICLALFLEDRAQCGRIVALDEAHKFLTQSGAAKTLTNDLTSIVRQQRHTGTRVLIATQEPTLAPELIDLCNATFVHRFLSPAWYEVLKKHLAGVNRYDLARNNASVLFDQIVALETGQALLFSPTALLPTRHSFDEDQFGAMGSSYIKIQIRDRVTFDGGKSILATETAQESQPKARIRDIPMHVVDQSAKKSMPPKRTQNVEKPVAHVAQEANQKSAKKQKGNQARRVSIFADENEQVLKNTPSRPEKPTLSKVQKEAKKQMQKNYDELNWHYPQDVSWSSFFTQIEVFLALERGTLRHDPEYQSLMRDAGIKQLRKCRNM